MMWLAVTAVKMVVSLRNTKTNTPLLTLDIIGGDTMKIKCPYCGSEEYDVYDICGGSGEDIQERCTCFNCDKQFSVTYIVVCVEKES
jgi:transposase-like protein